EINNGLAGWYGLPDLWPKNVLGKSDQLRSGTNNTDFVPAGGDTRVIRVSGATVQPNEVVLRPNDFILVGPNGPSPPGTGEGQDGRGTITVPGVPPNPLWLQSARMKYTGGLADRQNGVTVSLRRLANPYLPPENQAYVDRGPPLGRQPNPWYNPYVTVD